MKNLTIPTIVIIVLALLIGGYVLFSAGSGNDLIKTSVRFPNS
ncbi:MAG: hypothetical protein PF503_24660 [Desulfobacula sp.]|nr:hypothetical protein [Desulfobacula sp.]